MYTLFTRSWNPTGGVAIPPEFEYVRRTYERELDTVINYYGNRNFAVMSNHILVRLINLAFVPLDYNSQRFLDLVSARAGSIARHFQFTSPVSQGKMHEGLFYNGCQEMILLTSDYFDVDECVHGWRNVEAVKVLEHPISEMNLLLPNGRKNTSETGIATIEINLGKLLAQHRGFVLEQQRKVVGNMGTIKPDTQFVYNYVLPHMLRSHAEIAIFNRLVNLQIGAPMGEALIRHPFPVVDYTDKLDNILVKVLERLKNANQSFPTMLENIPGIRSGHMLSQLRMPDFAPTRQVWWALLLTRLKAMSFLLGVSSPAAINHNRSLLNDLRIDCRQILRDNVLQTMLPKDLFYDVNSLITKLSKL